jgi:hypothetical protein
MSLSTDLSPFQQALLQLSEESPLIHRNADRSDPPSLTESIPEINHEPLLLSTLCSTCNSIEFLPALHLPEAEEESIRRAFPRDEDWVFDRRIFYTHHPSLSYLKTSAQEGCHYCLLIWNDAFSKFEWTEEELGREEPVVLDQMLGMSEEEWSADWWPGNGSSLGVTWGGRVFAFGKMVLLQLSRAFSFPFQFFLSSLNYIQII